MLASFCPSRCGNLIFDYPFGIGSRCYRHPNFSLTCDDTVQPPRLYLQDTTIEVIDDIDTSNYGSTSSTNFSVQIPIHAIPVKPGVAVYNMFWKAPIFTLDFAVLNITGCDFDAYWVDQETNVTWKLCEITCPDATITGNVARQYCNGTGCCSIQFNTYLSAIQLKFVLNGSRELTNHSALWDNINVTYASASISWSIMDQPTCASAIDKSRPTYACEKEFGKEMLILSQINHRNVVKLYGCCLEVEVPMLVYEFIPNGTLYQLIHGQHLGPRVSFATRLKIVHEAAEALAYLHSWASPPIIHGDVKSANILIDEGYTVKVSDFGASTLAPTDEAQFVIQGTYGYLDPEYMQTSKLTGKSDVYSFGVVILELLTCRKAMNLEAIDEEINLSAHFLLAVSENRLGEILDEQIKGEESMELIEQVAELAKLCLEMASEKRPAMREVADELERFRNLSQHHPWGQETSEDELRALLVGSPNSPFEIEISNGAYLSMTDSAYLGVQSPR
nr:unnamed protein product [Digitaria exilis]